MDTTHAKLPGDVTVVVPSSQKLMTTFVLREQGDWFEDEIRFIRTLIKPGMKVIDIGANYGVYTLSIARLIGDSGKVWAFEPTTKTAAHLRESIEANNFTNIQLIQSGLSDHIGEASFFVSDNSELNTLSSKGLAGEKTETISLLTLDYCKQEHDWTHIDFIKLDAEGEESNILKAGTETLTSLSPLIMFELKNGDEVNLPLINEFKDLGYNCYRLIPGLNVLVPFDPHAPIDKYLLNLFCCKDDRGKELESLGVIVSNRDKNIAIAKPDIFDYINNLNYGSTIQAISVNQGGDDSDQYLDILATYLLSRSDHADIAVKVSALMNALDRSQQMINEGEQSIERLVSFSRIAFDAGERTAGVSILADLITRYATDLDFEIKELLLPALQRYEDIVPDDDTNQWLISSVIEQFLLTHFYSAYFSGDKSLPLYGKLMQLGYMDDNMQNRYQLVLQCFSQPN